MSPLEKLIRGIIDSQGALSLAAYMELALQHPQYGYYRTREPIGRKGDFITAPEVSQMFGEMIGVWCAEAWRKLGRPSPFALVELGPGRGTMMRDALRATAHVKGLHEALNLFLMESNAAMQSALKENLGSFAPRYITNGSELPPIPLLIIANEFFDALPVRQFEKTFNGWQERMVGVENDALAVVLRPLSDAENSLIPPALQKALPGTVFEFSLKAEALMREWASRLAACKGAMLIVDYGYAAPSGTATVQAVSKHAFTDILENPGEIDLTAHVDFEALGKAAKAAGCAVSAVMGQGEFLENCGIRIRAELLKKNASASQAAEIDSALSRLLDESQMGTLFKVMEIGGKELGVRG